MQNNEFILIFNLPHFWYKYYLFEKIFKIYFIDKLLIKHKIHEIQPQKWINDYIFRNKSILRLQITKYK